MRLVALTTAAIVGATFIGASSPAAHAATIKTKTVASVTIDPTETSRKITVNPGDYLSKIAETNKSTVQRVYAANTDINNPDLIFPGQEVRVPADSEQLADRPLPVKEVMAAAAPAAPVAPVATPAPIAMPAPVRASVAPSAPAAASGGVWDRLAACESGGNWAINTGNGFYGGLQFTLSSWRAAGGSGYPNDASREEQIARAQSLLASQGWGAWPACSAKLGLR